MILPLPHYGSRPSVLIATIGVAIAEGGLLEAGKIILHHHERFGGHGYPHGLRGREIPLGSRIVSIADACDAMIQDRPYKRAGRPLALDVERRISA